MNVYRLFEQLGARAAYDGEVNLDDLDIDPALKRAIEEKDQSTIERILGSDSSLMMILVPAEDDEPSEDEPAEDDEQEIRRAG